MLVRTYRAKNLQQALLQVKAELGDDATVVSTRRVRAGLLSSRLEVTAALASVALKTTTPKATPSQAQAARRAYTQDQSRQARGPALMPQQLLRCISPLRVEIKALRSEMQQVVSSAKQNEADLTRQIEDLRVSMTRGTGSTNSHSAPFQESLWARLEQTGMQPTLIEELRAAVSERLPQDPIEARACLEALAADELTKRLTCAEPLESTATRRVAAIVGPPGVGKSTMVAKIAARAALVHDLRTAIVACDINRLGAETGLIAAARAIDIPYVPAHSEQELTAAMETLGNQDLVLLDTGGHTPRETDALDALRRGLHRVSAETHLLVGADMRSLELDGTVECFSEFKPQSIAFTKLDQAVGYGGVYNAMRSSDLPVMYLSNGRRIPDDIEPATPERLVSLIVGLAYN